MQIYGYIPTKQYKTRQFKTETVQKKELQTFAAQANTHT